MLEEVYLHRYDHDTIPTYLHDKTSTCNYIQYEGGVCQAKCGAFALVC